MYSHTDIRPSRLLALVYRTLVHRTPCSLFVYEYVLARRHQFYSLRYRIRRPITNVIPLSRSSAGASVNKCPAGLRHPWPHNLRHRPEYNPSVDRASVCPSRLCVVLVPYFCLTSCRTASIVPLGTQCARTSAFCVIFVVCRHVNWTDSGLGASVCTGPMFVFFTAAVNACNSKTAIAMVVAGCESHFSVSYHILIRPPPFGFRRLTLIICTLTSLRPQINRL